MGQTIKPFTYKTFLRKTSKASPNSQLYLNSDLSLTKHKQSKPKEYRRHRIEIKEKKKRRKEKSRKGRENKKKTHLDKGYTSQE